MTLLRYEHRKDEQIEKKKRDRKKLNQVGGRKFKMKDKKMK